MFSRIFLFRKSYDGSVNLTLSSFKETIKNHHLFYSLPRANAFTNCWTFIQRLHFIITYNRFYVETMLRLHLLAAFTVAFLAPFAHAKTHEETQSTNKINERYSLGHYKQTFEFLFTLASGRCPQRCTELVSHTLANFLLDKSWPNFQDLCR